MKFIKYKQVARITFYGFDDLYRNNNSSVSTEPLNSSYFVNNLENNIIMFFFTDCTKWFIDFNKSI